MLLSCQPPRTQCAAQCVNKTEQAQTWATGTQHIHNRHPVHTCREETSHYRRCTLNAFNCSYRLSLGLISSAVFPTLLAIVDHGFPFVCVCVVCRSQHPRCPGGGPPGPPAHAVGQHAAGRGRGGPGERRRICRRRSCSRGFRRGGRQLH